MKNVVLYGGTGQAKVIRPLLEQAGSKVVCIVDDLLKKPPFPDIPLLKGLQDFLKWRNKNNIDENLGFVVTIGNPNGKLRVRFSDKLKREGLVPVSVVAMNAYIEKNAILDEGHQIHPGAIIMAQARIGRYCIINTKASVDHECIIEEGSEIGPGATLSGQIVVRKNVWVGAGATILPFLEIGENSIVGAGSVVTKDVPSNSIYIGVAAKPMKKCQTKDNH